jgi:hypothetical protein
MRISYGFISLGLGPVACKTGDVGRWRFPRVQAPLTDLRLFRTFNGLRRLVTVKSSQATSSVSGCPTFRRLTHHLELIWRVLCSHDGCSHKTNEHNIGENNYRQCRQNVSEKSDSEPCRKRWSPGKTRVAASIMCPRDIGTFFTHGNRFNNKTKKTPWSESASKLYWPSDRRLSAKRLPTFADRGCHVVSVTDPSGRILISLIIFSLIPSFMTRSLLQRVHAYVISYLKFVYTASQSDPNSRQRGCPTRTGQ